MVKKLVFLFLVFVGFFSVFSNAFASTVVVDDIFENTTWNLAGSPYIVKESIMVASDVTLAIEPGVIVKVDPSGSINILGTFSAEGTNDNHIYFTSLLDDSIGGDTNGDGNKTIPILSTRNNAGIWGGIRFYSARPVSLKNVDISFSRLGFDFLGTSAVISNITGRKNEMDLSIYANSNIIINGGNLNDSLYYAIQMSDSTLVADNLIINGTQKYQAIQARDSDLTLTDSLIKNLKDTTQAIAVNGPFTINLERVTLKNANNIVGYDGTVINLKDSSLDNSYVLVWGASTLNMDNSIIKNSRGIIDYNQEDTFNITKSKIINNDYGIYLYQANNRTPMGDSVFNVSDTTIANNSQYGVYSLASYSINFENVWWGDASGPQHPVSNPGGLGNAISDNVLFDPWCKDEVCAPGFSNILFLPGLEASRLYTPRTNGSEDQLWEPNGNSDVEDLYLNTNGTSKNSNIYTRDIIKESNTPITTGSLGQNIYKSFANTMDQLVSDEKIKEWKPFAYDWRQGVDDIVNNGTKYQDSVVFLTDTLQSLVDSSKNGKVTIIAHSNGGLLAKALLKKLQDAKIAGINNLIDNVDVLILVAVPEIGTASAVPAILHGYDQSMAGGWLMDEVHAREIGRNMSGAYGLLPSKEYLDHMSASPATFVDNLIPSDVTTKLVQAFGGAVSSYAEYKDFLFGNEGRVNPAINQMNLPIILSEDLFTKAETLHNSIDAFVPPSSMRVIEVAGWGLDTIASFEYYPRLDCGGSSCKFTLDERPRFTVDGDKTVVVPSAQYMSSDKNVEKYLVDIGKYNYSSVNLPKKEHKNILEINQLNNLILSVIKNEAVSFDLVLKDTEPIDDSNRFRISIHSPVTLDAYDIAENHTGKICPSTSDFCYKEENITNSSYLEFGEGKYINLPEDQFSKIKLQGTDIGTFTYDSEKVLPDGASAVSSFVDIPVTTQTQAEIIINSSTQEPQLALDVTGDGINDFTITPNANFDPILYLQIMRATIDSLDLPSAKIKPFDNRIDNVIKLIQKGKIDQAKLVAQNFKSFLGKITEKSDPKNLKPKKLSKTDAQLLFDMLNKLLDNLN